MKSITLAWALAGTVAFPAAAKLELGAPFSDSAVLQQGRPVPVWGWAEPGRKITVSYNGNSSSAVVASSGKWLVRLPPMKASRVGHALRVDGDGVVELRDVMVGEVWLVSGQSNSAFPLNGATPHNTDAEGGMTAQLTRKPLVRYLHSFDGYNTATAACERTARPIAWRPFLPQHLSADDAFSALGVYYALELYSALEMPIGVIGAYLGATSIEPWIPASGFASLPEFKSESEWRVSEGGGNQQPSALWNRKLAPLVPYAVRGVIWYQGCSNRKAPARYCRLMHALYNGWSKEFENPGLKLYFAQLAPFSPDWPALWEQQAQFEREEPHAAMAILSDLGCLTDIHPNSKRPVARRLAAHALKRDYGFNITDNSPTLTSWKLEGNRFVLSFADVKRWICYNADWSIQTGFEIAGADGAFRPARIVNMNDGATNSVMWKTDGRIVGRDLIVVSDEIAAPRQLRYLYSKPWKGCLYNEVNLPLGAFRVEL